MQTASFVGVPLFSMELPNQVISGGERGIRTLDTGFPVYSLSRRAPSTYSAISPNLNTARVTTGLSIQHDKLLLSFFEINQNQLRNCFQRLEYPFTCRSTGFVLRYIGRIQIATQFFN